MLKNINRFLKSSGINLTQLINSIEGISQFYKNYQTIKSAMEKSEIFRQGDFIPCLSDRFNSSGIISEHYFYQDLFVAQLINKNNPVKHVDIGSRLDGFISHIASFREIEVFDIREMKKVIPNVTFHRADLMSRDFNLIDYCDSVSSLHAIEHFGLGRYGDNVDYFGYLKGLDNIYKMLKSGGRFYFSVPVGGIQRIEFDAHRIFSLPYLIKLFMDKYQIASFSYIDDNDVLHKNIEPDINNSDHKRSFNLKFGCGIFELIKL